MSYYIIDSGFGKRLEQVGDYLLIRPYAQAIWSPSMPEKYWHDAHAEFKGNMDGGKGKWVFHKEMKREFVLKTKLINFECRLTDYGHIGLFYEQYNNWEWLAKHAIKEGRYLNLFAYTGGSSIALASKAKVIALASKAKVTHLDASKPVVNWGRINAKLSDISDNSIRWITDDVLKFVNRELKRNNKYDGIIMDPPTFGRGSKGEIWKIEKNLRELLMLCKELLTERANLFLLSAHASGFTHHVLKNCLADIFPEKLSQMESDDLLLVEKHGGREIPLGAYARWVSL